MRKDAKISDLSPDEQEIERAKKRAYNRRYQAEHKDAIRARKKAYMLENATRLKEKWHADWVKNKEKLQAKNREQYRKHREKRLEYARKYAEEHHDEHLARSKARYMAKRDIINAKRRAEYAANPEPRKTMSRVYREANRAKVLEGKRRYHQSVRGKISHHKGCILRRARMAAVTVVKCDSGIHWSTVAERQGSMTCSICGKECVCTPDRRGSLYPTVDHIIPISKGGSHTWDNVRLACRGCNTAKRDRLPAMVKGQLQEQRQQLSSEGKQLLVQQMQQGG